MFWHFIVSQYEADMEVCCVCISSNAALALCEDSEQLITTL